MSRATCSKETKMKNVLALLLATPILLLGACGDDDDTMPDGGAGSAGSSGAAGSGGSSSSGKGGSDATSQGGSDAGAAGAPIDMGDAGQPAAGGGGAPRTQFTVTLENVATAKSFTSAGVFDTPAGADAPGPLTPGKKYEFTVNAGRKQKLSFATMLAATNDVFFGPSGDGIALYDDDGEPISRDVTDEVSLWDAGTEINEEPKVGPNTVSKQAAPDTGPAENGNVVKLSDTDDAFDYPSVAEVMKVSVAHLDGTRFKVTIENVSSDTALQTSEGDFAAPMSPGVWVIHGGRDPLFTAGMPDRGQGLEHIAEDGNPTMLGAFVADDSGITYPASPGAWVVHTAGSKPLFSSGEPDYGDGIEHIAEDGNPTMLGEALSALNGQISSAIFNTPVGSAGPGPILPGSKYRFTFEASPGDTLSFASMLAATNDVFFAPNDGGIELFDAEDAPITGDVSDQIYLWDAGTEDNEEPGIGPNTVTNQSAPDTGTDGEGIVQRVSAVDDGYDYPAPAAVLKVTITAK
jgi:hypothetical protein